MDLGGGTDSHREDESESTTEMLAKLLEPGEQGGAAIQMEFLGIGAETKSGEKAKDALGCVGGEEPEVAGAKGVEREADGDSLAVGEAMGGHRFELMGRPMAKVEGPGGTELEGIATGGNMTGVEFGGATNGPANSREISLSESGRLGLEGGEEGGILEESNFDRLDQAVATST